MVCGGEFAAGCRTALYCGYPCAQYAKGSPGRRIAQMSDDDLLAQLRHAERRARIYRREMETRERRASRPAGRMVASGPNRNGTATVAGPGEGF